MSALYPPLDGKLVCGQRSLFCVGACAPLGAQISLLMDHFYVPFKLSLPSRYSTPSGTKTPQTFFFFFFHRSEYTHRWNKQAKGWFPVLRSHSLTSKLNCCSAPRVSCLTSASSKSCIKDVAKCLQADIHAVWATFPWNNKSVNHNVKGLKWNPNKNYQNLCFN